MKTIFDWTGKTLDMGSKGYWTGWRRRWPVMGYCNYFKSQADM